MLAYYRNNLTHIFLNESEIACTLLGISALQDIQKGVSIDLVWERTSFVKSLLSDEFIVRDSMKTKADFLNVLIFMSKRGFLSLDHPSNQIKLNIKDSNHQLSQSFLYHLLLPFVESYWMTLTYFTSVEKLD